MQETFLRVEDPVSRMNRGLVRRGGNMSSPGEGNKQRSAGQMLPGFPKKLNRSPVKNP